MIDHNADDENTYRESFNQSVYSQSSFGLNKNETMTENEELIICDALKKGPTPSQVDKNNNKEFEQQMISKVKEKL